MNETTDEPNAESLSTPVNTTNAIEDSIASRTKEITKRPKRERSPPVHLQALPTKIRKIKEVAPKLPDKTKWIMEEQKQFFSALRIYGKNFEALGQFFNSRRRLINPEAQKRTFGQIRCFYYRSFRTVSKLCSFNEEEKSNVDSFELRSVLAYLCLKPRVKCFDKKPTISVLHQLIRNGNAFLRVKGQREHVSIIGKALKPPKTSNGLGSAKQTDRTLSKHVKIVLSPSCATAYMRVAMSCRYPHVEILLSRTTTISELIDKLTQYWQLNQHAQSLFKEDFSLEQLILYPHGSSVSSPDAPAVAEPASLLDLTPQKISPPQSDAEHVPEPTPVVHVAHKANLARTAILLAAKRALSNNADSSTFTLTDGTEDEADSSAGSVKQRFDAVDFTDEFASEDEIEVDPNTATPTTAPATPMSTPTTINPTVTATDISQGITRLNPLLSTLTVGELQKLLQRPKELRLTYDFHNALRSNGNHEWSSSTTFLHYTIQMANQCLAAIADRQSQVDTKTTKRPSAKKQQTSRSKCVCSCCSHHQHSPFAKDQRRPSNKTSHSPNNEIFTLLHMPNHDTSVAMNDDISTTPTPLQGPASATLSDTDTHHKSSASTQLDEHSSVFDAPSWPAETVTISKEQSQLASLLPRPTSPIALSTDLSPSLSLLLPMTTNHGTDYTPPSKPTAIMFSSTNGVIDDPLIQSLAAEQAASAHNYDLLSHRYKRVRRPLRYGDQSTRSSNIQLLLDANLNAQQSAAAASQRLAFHAPSTSTSSTRPNNPFHSDCEHPNDLLNENSNLSSVSLSTTIINAALQSNIARLRLDWPDNMSDLSFGSFPDLLESNAMSIASNESTNSEQSPTANANEPNKCTSDTLFAMNNTTNLLLQN